MGKDSVYYKTKARTQKVKLRERTDNAAKYTDIILL